MNAHTILDTVDICRVLDDEFLEHLEENGLSREQGVFDEWIATQIDLSFDAYKGALLFDGKNDNLAVLRPQLGELCEQWNVEKTRVESER